MAKAIEGTYETKKVAALVQADYHMHIRWMLSWRAKEFKTLTEVMRHHRGHSAYLFNDLPSGARSRARSRSRSSSRGLHKLPKPPKAPAMPHAARPEAVHNDWPVLAKANAAGKKLCKHYNTTKGGARGSKCQEAHECDYLGCGLQHSRAAHHPRPK